MLEAIRGAQQDHHLRDLHLLVGQDRRGVRRGAVRARARRRQGARAARLGRQRQDGQAGLARDEGGRASRSGATTRCAGTPSATHQQPHAPQAAGRRRPHRLHRRRRHRRRMDRQRAGPGALARHAFPRRGPGGGADAGGLHGQLGQDHRRRCCTARTTFRRVPAAGRQLAQVFASSPGGGSESMQLMYLLSIAAAAKTHPAVGRLLRARRRRASHARRGARSAA